MKEELETKTSKPYPFMAGGGEMGGNGLGLVLCKKIAARHAGTITAESEEGIGSVFHVTLPLQQNIAINEPHA